MILASQRRTLVLLGVGQETANLAIQALAAVVLRLARGMALAATSVALAPASCCVGHRLGSRLWAGGRIGCARRMGCPTCLARCRRLSKLLSELAICQSTLSWLSGARAP